MPDTTTTKSVNAPKDDVDVDSSFISLIWRDIPPTSSASPNFPLATFASHLIFKGVQAGGTIGALSLLYHGGYRGLRGCPALLGATVSTAASAAVGFTLFNCTAATMKIQSEDRTDGVEDRAYRVYHNAGLNRMDRYAILGAGPAVALTMWVSGITPRTVLGGAALGSFLGITVSSFTAKGKDDDEA